MKPSLGKIIVATDFSDLSGEAVQYAQSLADTYQAELLLIHVIDDAPALAFHTMELTTDILIEDTTKNAEVHLQQFVKDHDIRSPKGLRLVTRRGNPHEEITRFAREEKAGLIVMATHGRTGLAHVLLGSVAEKVVQHSDIPVLTIKPVRVRSSMHQTESSQEHS